MLHIQPQTHTCTSQQQEGMFQLADVDRCCAVFVCVGRKVECSTLCQLVSVLISLPRWIMKNEKNIKIKKTGTLARRGVRSDLLNQILEWVRDDPLEYMLQVPFIAAPCSVLTYTGTDLVSIVMQNAATLREVVNVLIQIKLCHWIHRHRAPLIKVRHRGLSDASQLFPYDQKNTKVKVYC